MSQSVAPEILWAQRSSDEDLSHNIIYLTINVPDLQPGYTLEFPSSSSLSFKGISGGSQTVSSTVPAKTYEIQNLELFGELDLSVERKESVNGKSLQVQLTKKELKIEYWPRLTKDKRVNFVKTDFARWVDEDEQEGAAVDDNFASTDAPAGAGMDMEAMMASMGGGGMGGMGGPGGMGGMGGMGGAGGMGGMDIQKMLAQMKASGDAGEGADSDSSDDDEMPPLEDAPAAAATTTA